MRAKPRAAYHGGPVGVPDVHESVIDSPCRKKTKSDARPVITPSGDKSKEDDKKNEPKKEDDKKTGPPPSEFGEK